MRILTLTIFLLTNTIIGQGQNLISNWTFEDGSMNLVCQDWFDRCGNELTVSCDTNFYCEVGFYNQSPSVIPEEVWSIKLTASYPPDEGLAQTYVTGQSGTYIYQLQFVMKSDSTLSGYPATGSASIGTISQGQFVASKTLTDTASIWTTFSFTDTLTTQTTDTIAVKLSAGMCDFCINTVFYDFIELTVIDTLTSINDLDQIDDIKTKIYPNPSADNITIEIKSGKNENCTLTIYNSTGQLIKTIKTSKNIVTIENEHISSGLYFYQIQSTVNKKEFGQGIFIIQ